MPFNITVYGTAPQPLDLKTLNELLSQDAPKIEQIAPGRYQLTWERLSVRLNLMTPGDIPNHLRGLTGYLASLRAHPALVERTRSINQVMALIIEPDVDSDGHTQALVLGLTARFNGMFFAANAFYDKNNALLAGAPGTRKQFFHVIVQPTPASLARKKRSEAILQRDGVPFIEHLPPVASDETVTLRTKDDIARRAMCLCLVASYATGMPPNYVSQLTDRYGLKPFFSPDERAFLDNPAPDDEDKFDFSWRFESYHLLLWALGYIDELSRPDAPSEADPDISVMQQRSAEKFIADAKVRAVSDILDATDLIYRYSWSTVDARVRHQPPPAGLHPGVIYERHYALNWLIRYGEQDWDDVSTDT